MGHIFISYSRKDRGFADDLLRDLAGRGLRCWIDRDDIDGGTQWREEIASAIRQCEVFLVLLSPHSVRSVDVGRELAFAESLGRRIVPVLVQAAVVPDRMAYSLGGLQRIDFAELTYEHAFDLLVRALQPERPAPPVSRPKLLGWIAAAYILAGANFLASFGVCWWDVAFGVSRTQACLDGLGLSLFDLVLIDVLLVLTVAAGITLLASKRLAGPVLVSHWVLQLLLVAWALFQHRYWAGMLVALAVSAPAVLYVLRSNRQDPSAASRFAQLHDKPAAGAQILPTNVGDGGAS